MQIINGQVLITGGAGYIGSHTVHYLISIGVEPCNIIVFDNLEFGHIEHIPSGVVFIKGDLRNKVEICNVFHNYNIDCVIHFAAYAYVGESMKNPSKYFTNNISAGLILLDAMRDNSCTKIVFSSSCATYGSSDNKLLTEQSIQKPINPYGESKLVFERFLVWYQHAYNIQSISLRYFNAAGADFNIGEMHDPETHLIPLAINAALYKESHLQVFGSNYPTADGTCIRDFIHVTDLAKAHALGIGYLQKGGTMTSINLGSGIGVSIMKIINLIESLSGKKVKFSCVSERLGDAPYLVSDNRKALKVLGWKPEIKIEGIISSALNWHKQH